MSHTPPQDPSSPVDGDLTALVQQWKELDMQTLTMAVDTGRLRTHARGITLMLRALLAMQLLMLALSGWQLLTGHQEALQSVAILAAGLLIFVPSMRWQARARAHAEQAMGDSTTAVLETRRRLLHSAIADIDSTRAKVVLLASALLTGALFAIAASGGLPWALPAIMAALLAAHTVWSFTRRLPRLRAERAAVVALQAELTD